MANVLHRITKVYKTSQDVSNTVAFPTKYPVSDWIINPDITGLENVPRQYIKITGDMLSEMNAAEKAAVDAAMQTTIKNNIELETQFGPFKPVIAALVKTINIRLLVGQKITASEIVDAIRAEIDNG